MNNGFPHHLFYVGAYTKRGGEGIYLCRMDRETGALGAVELAARAVNPSFVALDSRRRFLYAVGESSESGGTVRAFSIDPDSGRLEPINSQPSGGRGPCHVAVDATDRCVLVANYGSGAAAVLPVRDDGGLDAPSCVVQHEGAGVHAGRQEGPHAHSINVDPSNRFALVADLGIDKVKVYRLDPARGTLEPADTPWADVRPGAGPRHLAFHPDGRRAYLIDELDSTLVAYAWDAEVGRLTETQSLSTLPERYDGVTWCADVHVAPDGRTVYGSNRGHDSIAVFRIDEASGNLSPVQFQSTGGAIPRGFALTPDGRFLVAGNQDSDSIVVLAVDPDTGLLAPTGHRAGAPMPVCICFA